MFSLFILAVSSVGCEEKWRTGLDKFWGGVGLPKTMYG
jgi:hypothetical protein